MSFFERIIAFFVVAVAALATLFSGGVNDQEYDLVAKFESQPSSGYAWVVDISDEEKATLENQTFLSGFDSIIDGIGLDCFCINAKENGAFTLTFSYIYKDNEDKVKDEKVYYCVSYNGEIEVLNPDEFVVVS